MLIQDMENTNSRLSAHLPDSNILHCRRRRWRSLPHDCLAPRTNEDSIPDSGSRSSQLHRRMELPRKNVEGRRMERIHAWKWHKLYSYRPLQCMSIRCLHHL
jgi:hypothetical protein